MALPVGSVLAALVWWWMAAPSSELEIEGPVHFAPMDPALVRVQSLENGFGSTARRIGVELPGYDDVVVFADGTALASAMDGWIWRIDLASGTAERWLDAPLMPAGLRIDPRDSDLLYFCSAFLHGQSYPATERVGLYSLRLSTKHVDPVVLDVPQDVGRSDSPEVFSDDAPVDESGIRALAFCNDLDVSTDGQRIYFSEPFAYEGASMGGGAVGEAIALGRNGRLWMHDRGTGTTRLVARGFHFLDGVLIEPRPGGGRESSILVTETTRFRIQRIHARGADAGQSEIVWRNLPGMPDGLDRDDLGNVWVGLLGLRSATTDWIHAHPWIKPLLLRVPTAWIPKGESTGVLALDPRGDEALFLGLHDGSFVRDVSVAIPSGERIYLASFDPTQRGLVWMPRPTFPMQTTLDAE
jgi:sugar lactone lactonase YvrE